MEKLRILTADGLIRLRNDIERNMDFYREGNTNVLDPYFDESNTYETSLDLKELRFESPRNESGEILPKQKIALWDYYNARILLRTYPEIDTLTAVQEAFWATLTHRLVPEYMVARWQPDESESMEKQMYTIRSHYFFERQESHRNLEKNGTSRLWNLMRLTRSDDLSESVKLAAKALGHAYLGWHLCTRSLSNSDLLVKAVLRGVLRFEELEGKSINEDMFRQLGMYLNAVGASRCLDFIVDEVEEITIEYLKGWGKSVSKR